MPYSEIVELTAEDQQLIALADRAVAFARAMIQPGRAVIVDVETTSLSGAICEIAAVDAATGLLLLDTLVNAGVPISAEAYAVHGISDAEVTALAVPTWPTVFAHLQQIVAGRSILAYNADYDRDIIWGDCRRYGLWDPWIMNPAAWADVMAPRSHHRYQRRFLKNGGGHRAAGDVITTWRHLLDMTQPISWPPAGRNND